MALSLAACGGSDSGITQAQLDAQTAAATAAAAAQAAAEADAATAAAAQAAAEAAHAAAEAAQAAAEAEAAAAEAAQAAAEAEAAAAEAEAAALSATVVSSLTTGNDVLTGKAGNDSFSGTTATDAAGDVIVDTSTTDNGHTDNDAYSRSTSTNCDECRKRSIEHVRFGRCRSRCCEYHKRHNNG